IFVLDTSGSMDGPRIDSLKRALINLTGADNTLTGQFASFRQREQVTMILFNTTVYQQRDFTVNDTGPSSPALPAIRSFVNSLQASGGTAIFDAVERAYQVAARDIQQEPDRYYSVVLMTDGENNNGHDVSHFLATYQPHPPAGGGVKPSTSLLGRGTRQHAPSL